MMKNLCRAAFALTLTACAILHRVPEEVATPMRVVAGDGTVGFADGSEARFHKPIRLAPLGEDSIVVADIYNHAIRLVHGDGRVETLAGGPDRQGHGDGPAGEARLASPHGVAVSPDGRIAIAEASGHTIRLLAPMGGGTGATVTTYAGRPGESGFRDGAATEALFSSPHAVQWMPDGGLLVADIGNASLRLIKDSRVTTVVGKEAKLVYPMDIALAPDGSVVIADAGTNQLARWRPGGAVETIELDAPLSTPHGVSVASDGTIYVADMGTHRVRAVDATGHVTTVCGTGQPGSLLHELNRPAAVLVHAGKLWIADLENHQIKVFPLD